eukprot:COSAG05_NODE_6374_length_971_cov_1.111239_2_plen_73_part_01
MLTAVARLIRRPLFHVLRVQRLDDRHPLECGHAAEGSLDHHDRLLVGQPLPTRRARSPSGLDSDDVDDIVRGQ